MTFIPFGSLDEAVEFMASNERAANERVTDAQREIGWGSHFLRAVFFDDGPLLIFGEITTLEDLERSELGESPDDEDREEWEFTRAMTLDSYERGYRYGRCYSVVEPDGEFGSTHISTAVPISVEQFDQARAAKWDLHKLFPRPDEADAERWLEDVGRAIYVAAQ